MTEPPRHTGSPPPEPGTARAQEEEITRLRRQVQELTARLEATTPPPAPPAAPERTAGHGFRGGVAAVLVFLAAFGIAASLVSVWAERTALNTDRWVSTVGPLPQNTQVNAAVAQYLTTETFQLLRVENRVAEALPPRASFLAGPLTGQVRDYLRKSVNKVLGTPQFEAIWTRVNRLAHAQAVAVLEGRSQVVRVQGNRVTLNLLPVVNEVLRSLDKRIPTIFGKDINLPKITSGQVPAGLQTKVEQALGVPLPDNFAKITVYRGAALGTLQDALRVFERAVAALVIGTLILLALALLISPGRRRTVLQLGVWVAVAVVVLGALIRAVMDQVLQDVPAGTYRNGVEAGLAVVFQPLSDRGNLLLWLGVLLALVAYLVGPGRGARAVRRGVARGGRVLASQTGRGAAFTRANGPGFARDYLDALRVVGVVLAALVTVLWVRSWWGLLVLLVVLLVYEGVVTLAARSAPEAPAAAPSPAEAAPTGEAPTEEAALVNAPTAETPIAERPTAEAPAEPRTPGVPPPRTGAS